MSLSKMTASMQTCADIVHPWTDSCLRANMTMMRYSSVGCGRLLVPWFLVRYAMELRKNKKLYRELTSDLTVEFLQSITVGSFIGTLFVSSSCAFRHVLGRFTYLSVVFLPGFFSGLPYFILGPKLRIQLLTVISNAALESIILKMSHSGLLTLNVYTETIFFMVVNSCLMYASKVSKPKDVDRMSWFYTPDEKSLVDSGKSFTETISKKIKKYFAIGLGIGLLSKLIRDVTAFAPKNVHKLLKLSTLKPGFFAASYVAIYEITVHALSRHFQKEKSIFSLPAGFLAGIAYAVEPNLTINLSAFINLIQLVYRIVDFRWLKRAPVDTLLFSLSMGTLFHIQTFHPKSISKIGSKFIRVGTLNKSNMIIDGIKKLNYSIV